jgi:hypothetical protein
MIGGLGQLGQMGRVGAPEKGVGVPPGFSLWTTNGQVWRFGAQAQRAISPSRT